MRCWHMNGAGNDFMVVDARGVELDYSALALSLCRRTGADGFMAVTESEIADFRLHFYNSDGSRGEMCGNGARCVCRFAYELGITGEKMTVQTDAGIVEGCRLDENRYRVKLNVPSVLDLHRKGDVAYVELGDPGVPHAVEQMPSVDWSMKEQLREHAVMLRHDEAFPKGANVNMFAPEGADTVRILTYERGVEDYTLACGTGSASVAAVLWMKGMLLGGRVTVLNPGGALTVQVEGSDGRVTAVWLEGPTEVTEIMDV